MTTDTRHIRSFDGLRGYAIFSVILYHGTYGLYRGGFLGVDLFFVLSGYLITSLLYQEYLTNKTIALGKFYMRRALRLYPALILCVIFCNILWSYSLFWPQSDRTIATVSGLFYFTDIVFDYKEGNMAHLWSLSVEEHFYLVWPLFALFVIFKINDQHKKILIVLILIALTILRIVCYLNEEVLVSGIFRISAYTFTLCRIDGIVLGALLYFWLITVDLRAWVNFAKRGSIYLIAIAIFFILFGFKVGRYSPYWFLGGFIITNFVCVATVFLAVQHPNHPFLTHRFVRWLGQRSYGIYAYHYPIFAVTEWFHIPNNNLNLLWLLLLRIILAFITAELSYRYIEQPILKYKSRFKAKVEVQE